MGTDYTNRLARSLSVGCASYHHAICNWPSGCACRCHAAHDDSCSLFCTGWNGEQDDAANVGPCRIVHTCRACREIELAEPRAIIPTDTNV